MDKWPPFAVWQVKRGFVCSDIQVAADWTMERIIPGMKLIAEVFDLFSVSMSEVIEFFREFGELFKENNNVG